MKLASLGLSTPGCETLNCSAIAIIAAPTRRTSTQERLYSPQWTKVALGSAKINFPMMKKTRTYRKPGVYLSGLALRVPWRYTAVEVLARAPSVFLSSVLAIDVPCLCLAPRAQLPTWVRYTGRDRVSMRQQGALVDPRPITTRCRRARRRPTNARMTGWGVIATAKEYSPSSSTVATAWEAAVRRDLNARRRRPLPGV